VLPVIVTLVDPALELALVVPAESVTVTPVDPEGPTLVDELVS
jgi:hypothetical protein